MIVLTFNEKSTIPQHFQIFHDSLNPLMFPKVRLRNSCNSPENFSRPMILLSLSGSENSSSCPRRKSLSKVRLAGRTVPKPSSESTESKGSWSNTAAIAKTTLKDHATWPKIDTVSVCHFSPYLNDNVCCDVIVCMCVFFELFFSVLSLLWWFISILYYYFYSTNFCKYIEVCWITNSQNLKNNNNPRM